MPNRLTIENTNLIEAVHFYGFFCKSRVSVDTEKRSLSSSRNNSHFGLNSKNFDNAYNNSDSFTNNYNSHSNNNGYVSSVINSSKNIRIKSK